MAISFLAFICMTVTGAAVVSMLGRRFNAQLNLALALGAGFFAAAATVGLWLVVTPLPLSLQSPCGRVVVTITLLVLARADRLALKEDICYAIAHLGHSKMSILLRCYRGLSPADTCQHTLPGRFSLGRLYHVDVPRQGMGR